MILNNDEPNWQLPSQAHKRTREKEGKGWCWKSWTSLRPERPGTRPKSTTKTNKRTDREKQGKQKQNNKAGQFNIPEANKPKSRAPNKEKNRRGNKGGRERITQAQCQKGERTTKREPGGRKRANKPTNPNNTKKRGRH